MRISDWSSDVCSSDLGAGGHFRQSLEKQFEGDYRIEFNLAPPLLAKTNKETGEPRKIAFGPWMMTAFGMLSRLKFLRGTPLDPFGRTEERRTERRLIAEYEATVEELLSHLTADNQAAAVEVARIPDQIRGFGHVKLRNRSEGHTSELP